MGIVQSRQYSTSSEEGAEPWPRKAGVSFLATYRNGLVCAEQLLSDESERPVGCRQWRLESGEEPHPYSMFA